MGRSNYPQIFFSGNNEFSSVAIKTLLHVAPSPVNFHFWSVHYFKDSVKGKFKKQAHASFLQRGLYLH